MARLIKGQGEAETILQQREVKFKALRQPAGKESEQISMYVYV